MCISACNTYVCMCVCMPMCVCVSVHWLISGKWVRCGQHVDTERGNLFCASCLSHGDLQLRTEKMHTIFSVCRYPSACLSHSLTLIYIRMRRYTDTRARAFQYMKIEYAVMLYSQSHSSCCWQDCRTIGHRKAVGSKKRKKKQKHYLYSI